uniref:ABC transporter ATP-binding protein n=1 Tax=Thermosporothrix sp. COM3 TaxID=2490863 RepID=A0A455SFZ4_9CHLR|nr:ABC transporter ATP-binding protein [Thermosporothrix sp. COM3]
MVASIPSRNSGGTTITIKDLSKCYKQGAREKWALKNVNLQIQPGVFGLLGRNGAGKTTLLQILATLLPQTSGEVWINNHHLKKEKWAIRSQIGIGFLPQEQGYYPKLTVQETLFYFASLQNVRHKREQIDELLEVVNLTEKKHARASTLSGGMRRRLGLAQALLGNPRVLIIDEPTAGLDPVEQQRFRMLLGTLGARREQTILLSTHIVADVATIAGSVAVLEQGSLRFQGSVQQLTQHASGACWQWRTTLETIEQMRQRRAAIIASLSPVPGGVAAPNEVIARVVGPCPAPEAVPCQPTLEDGYFLLIGTADLQMPPSFSAAALQGGSSYV